MIPLSSAARYTFAQQGEFFPRMYNGEQVGIGEDGKMYRFKSQGIVPAVRYSASGRPLETPKPVMEHINPQYRFYFKESPFPQWSQAMPERTEPKPEPTPKPVPKSQKEEAKYDESSPYMGTTGAPISFTGFGQATGLGPQPTENIFNRNSYFGQEMQSLEFPFSSY